MEFVAAFALVLLFAALPAGLSMRARRYKQAALVLLICLIAPFAVAIVAVAAAEPQHSDVSARLLESAAAGLMWFGATAVLLPLFCASVLWELGKFKMKPG